MTKQNEVQVQITKELQDTLLLNPKIKTVFFDRNGKHYFYAHKIQLHHVDEYNVSSGIEEVLACPGARRGLIKVNHKVNGKPVLKDALVNISCEQVVLQMSREQILAEKPVYKSTSEKEQLEILRRAAEIAKGGNYDALMDKLKMI